MPIYDPTHTYQSDITQPNKCVSSSKFKPTISWPDPTLEMLRNDPVFDTIWNTIKTWDINVPEAYEGYCGATGNHVRAIYDALETLCKHYNDREKDHV